MSERIPQNHRYVIENDKKFSDLAQGRSFFYSRNKSKSVAHVVKRNFYFSVAISIVSFPFNPHYSTPKHQFPRHQFDSFPSFFFHTPFPLAANRERENK